MLLVSMFQDVSSPGIANADPNAEVRAGSVNMQVELSAQKNAITTNVFRIHELFFDYRPCIDLSDLKAALVAFLISWGLLCMLFACNKEV